MAFVIIRIIVTIFIIAVAEFLKFFVDIKKRVKEYYIKYV